MTPFRPLALTVLATALLAGCGHTALPTAALLTERAPQPVAAATVAARPAATAASVTLISDAGHAVTGAEIPAAVATAMAAATAADGPSAALDLVTRKSTGTATTAGYMDPWAPGAIGVSDPHATSLTLSWTTDLPSRALIYYGKEFGFDYNGYTTVAVENNSSTYHQVTLTGLSRFRKYRFMVVGVAPMGLQYPSYAFDYRTRLF